MATRWRTGNAGTMHAERARHLMARKAALSPRIRLSLRERQTAALSVSVMGTVPGPANSAKPRQAWLFLRSLEPPRKSCEGLQWAAMGPRALPVGRSGRLLPADVHVPADPDQRDRAILDKVAVCRTGRFGCFRTRLAAARPVVRTQPRGIPNPSVSRLTPLAIVRDRTSGTVRRCWITSASSVRQLHSWVE